ncbi:hypothetical protein BRARA_C04402 [Brassica rapa]|uniref:Phosphoglycerate mutase family protein n=2 Tax=Brassica TaxID=3705 RepID=A0A398A780_BRACM|nr:uncharacterized protein At3g52155, chloroplastic-like [Brassica napus]KAH0935004.1 hypothetical protein HID58_012121 [Brassica napus]RID72514.1 hypothetical protein BRARA_C04402 [Brassica rapa]CAF2129809.1 unnamed protein product [Brassica napus]
MLSFQCPSPFFFSGQNRTTTTSCSTAPPRASTELTASPSSLISRRLILLRHAHSSWDHLSLKDHDRPLTKTGHADAAKVAQILSSLGWLPQLILSSDATRTKETLKSMQAQVDGFMEANVHFIPSFYSIAAMDGQTADHLQHIISKYSSPDITTVMCMGHNKGWEEAASMLSGASVKLKTCNAALLLAFGNSWDDAFSLAGPGGWKLEGIVAPDSTICV